jgi:hypothetical protein
VDRDRMEVVLIRGQKKEQAAWMLKHVGISDLKLVRKRCAWRSFIE